MDVIDFKLLQALEHDSRISLKTLAVKLNVKTSTIYHRLQKLKESKIIDRYSIVLNPDLMGFKIQVMMTIRIKKLVMSKLDEIFLENFANVLGSDNDEILFCSLCEDESILVIAALHDEGHLKTFKENLLKNPYVDKITVIHLTKIMKGKKLYEFNPKLFGTLVTNESFFDESNIQAIDESNQDELKDQPEDEEDE